MAVVFVEDTAAVFRDLPETTKRRAAAVVTLIETFPNMCPMRRRGLLRGYRYFIAERWLFYYRVVAAEIQVVAIIPAAMRRA